MPPHRRPLSLPERPRPTRARRPRHCQGGFTSSRHCFWHIWQYQRSFCSPLDLIRLAIALGLRKSAFPMAAAATTRNLRHRRQDRHSAPAGSSRRRPGRTSGARRPGARMRRAGALTFSGAVVEAPPCSPEGPPSPFTSRNGNGPGEGACGDASRWWGKAAGWLWG